MKRFELVLILALAGFSCSPSVSSRASGPAVSDNSNLPERKPEVEKVAPSWVDSLMRNMTIEEKVGQLIMARGYGHYISTESDEYERLVRLVEDVKVGGFVMFQGDVYAHAVLLNKLQRLAKIPLLISADFERGLAMRIRRATYFPDAMALGATRNLDYAYRVGKAIAEEARAIGVHQNLAPVADVNNNPRNPVINTRAYGEDRVLVAQMVEAFVKGTNDGRAISTAKHFPGHGDTGVDSHLELPVLPFDRARLDSIELMTFRRAIDAGVGSIMVAHLEIPALDSTPGIPATLSAPAITDLLKKDLGFKGLVVTDAMDMAGVTKGYSIGGSAVRAFKAGADILLMPADEQVAFDAVLAAVRRGEITQERLNLSVRKILATKQWLGLNTGRLVDIEKIGEFVSTRERRNLAKDVARDAITIVRNEGNILPLQRYSRKRLVSVIISDTDDNRIEVHRPSYQFPNEVVGAYFTQQLRSRYGRVETHRLTPSSNSLVFDSVLQRMKNADIVIMPLFVKVRTSTGRIGLPENLTGFFARASALKKPTIVISFGNPYLVGDFPSASGLVCAYSDAEVLVESCVEALFGEIPVRGKMPVSVPGQFPFGVGIEYAQEFIRTDDPMYAGFDVERLEVIDDLMRRAVRDSVFPGAQVIVARNGIIAYNKSFGAYTYDPSARGIGNETVFDLASLTKVVATTSAVMRLYDQKKLSLTDRVGRYIPEFSEGKKGSVTIRHLLTHSSGLPPYRRLWEICDTPQEALDTVLASRLVAEPGDTAIYSDLGLIILGKIVEKITRMPLDAYVKNEFFEPLGMANTMFNPPDEWLPRIAPTEIDTVWRKKLVRGIVHDENAALLGGVSGHAGLFSNASDLAVFLQMLLNKGKYGGRKYLAESTVREFTRKQGPSTSTRALGWDTKSSQGSSAGELFSATSYGHTGFTGTSLWIDPERNMFVIFLTNRVYPTRANTKIFQIRPALHDAVVKALMGKSKPRKGA